MLPAGELSAAPGTDGFDLSALLPGVLRLLFRDLGRLHSPAAPAGVGWGIGQTESAGREADGRKPAGPAVDSEGQVPPAPGMQAGRAAAGPCALPT